MGEAECCHARRRGTLPGPRRHRLAARAAVAIVACALLPAAGRAQTDGTRSVLDAYDLREKDPVQFDLGRALAEISGLAIDAAGRIFAHQDERGIVFELDPSNGHVVRTFRVGRNGVRGDFEGIAVSASRMFLISSDGTLAEFAPGADDSTVSYDRHQTGSRRSCREIEGLDFDAATDELLLACKFTSGRALRGRLVVLGYSLRTRTIGAQPRLSVPLDSLRRFGIDDELSPSGIAIHPISGTWFIVAARENVIVEISPAGRLLGAVKLRNGVHHQPEGIAFGRDGTLYIADEGRSGRATLTVYPPDPARLR